MPEPTGVQTAQDIARRAATLGAQIRRVKDRLLTRHQLAHRLFIGPDGEVTPAAVEWLRRMAADNYVDAPTFRGDRDRALINEGRRLLALEIIGSTKLDVSRLGALTRLEREVNDRGD